MLTLPRLVSERAHEAARRLLRNSTAGTRNEATRHAWIEATLASLPAGLRILDAGAGEQPYRSACTHLTYVSHDFSQYDGIGDTRGLQMGTFDYGTLDIVSDIERIPEPDSSFDAVLCTEVLEHVPDPVRALGELARLVKRGGHLIITAPFCSLTHFAPYHYCTGFNIYFYEKHLEGNGFKIVELRKNGGFFDYLAQELRRLASVTRSYTTTQLRVVDQIVIYRALRMLDRLNDADSGSNELVTFGCHVHARKL